MRPRSNALPQGGSGSAAREGSSQEQRAQTVQAVSPTEIDIDEAVFDEELNANDLDPASSDIQGSSVVEIITVSC